MSGVPSSEKTGRSTEKPSGFSIASSASSAPPSAGVTDGTADQGGEVFGGIDRQFHGREG